MCVRPPDLDRERGALALCVDEREVQRFGLGRGGRRRRGGAVVGVVTAGVEGFGFVVVRRAVEKVESEPR